MEVTDGLQVVDMEKLDNITFKFIKGKIWLDKIKSKWMRKERRIYKWTKNKHLIGLVK